MADASLEDIERLLAERELATARQEDTLTVEMGEDDEGRKVLFSILLFRGMMAELEELPEDYCSLQVVVAFPFQAKTETFAEVARAALFFNKMVDYPGFCLEESRGEIFYRYALPLRRDYLDEELFCQLLSAILGQYELVLPVFEEVATGEKGFLEIVAESALLAEQARKEADES